MQAVLAVLSGILVGFSLGLIGGGGSILATPLLLYVVGVRNPHVAIGTGALAVAANAFANFVAHARAGTVRWRNAAIFAVVGVAGAAVGSSVGKAFNGQRLLFLFAILMIVVGILMLRRRHDSKATTGPERITRAGAARLAVAALLVGALSGFFGIGGGFLIVPGLIYATGMPMINAVGSSLLSVGAFGVTTAANYALSGLVDWTLAGEFIGGGVVGGLLGMRLALRLSTRRNTLTRIFAGLIFLVAAYMLYRNAAALGL
ncbi:sulfite exporter TauE/SafE family protein [Rhodopila globiformis]|uniref:Probable membrane transporter protein n=1 Tax=Rhodopila globiformis TaxID=1071 RepID=A0A2S6NAJ9_RHOGL|nr:sulfite exporter TauE/SafE family protein [Rhodopila globiformis]PPQ31648.1 hypothetical protein CCS01_17010 [Rhodopila globiformis]